MMLADAFPQRVLRAKLQRLLWPDAQERNARHSLSEALRGIERVAGIPLDRTRLEVGLNKGAVRVDVANMDLASHVTSEECGSPILAEGLTAPTEQFDRWLTDRRVQSLRELSGSIRNELAEAVSSGNARHGLRLARWLDDHDQHTAETLEACTILNALVPPDGDTEEKSIKEEPSSAGQFVGREAEFRLLGGKLAAVLDGRAERALVLLTGVPGIGKTRLANRFARLAAIRGARVMTATAFEPERSLPYAVVADLFRDEFRLDELEGLAPVWLRTLAAIFPDSPVGVRRAAEDDLLGAQRRLFEAVAQAFELAGNRRPLLLIVDDLQWADTSSCQLLHYVLRRAKPEAGLMAVFSFREEEMFSLPEGDRLVHSIKQDMGGDRARLEPLSDADLRIWLRDLLPEKSSGEIDRIVGRASGNPLFACELAAAAPDEGVPPTLASLIRRQFGNLGGHAQRLAELLAVAAAPVSPRDAASLLGFSPAATLDAVGELTRNAWLLSDEALSLSHDLVREAIYFGLAPSTRVLLHSAIVEHFADAPVAFLAHHAYEARDRHRAFSMALEAARESRSTHAYAEELRWLHTAFHCAEDSGQKEGVAFTLMRQLHVAGRLADAIPIADEIERIGPSKESAVRIALVRFGNRAASQYERHDVLSDGLALLNTAFGSPWDFIQTARTCFNIAHAQGDKETITKIVGALRRFASSELEAQYTGEALQMSILYGSYYGLPARPEDVRRAASVARMGKSPDLLCAALQMKGVLLYHRGAVIRSGRILRKTLALADETGSILRKVNAHILLTVIETERARHDQAVEHATNGVAFADWSNLPFEGIVGRLNLAEAFLAASEYEACRQAAEKSLAAEQDHPVWFARVTCHSFIGLCALAEGRFSEAVRREEQVRASLPKTERWADDISYVAIFLARMDVIRGNPESGLALLKKVGKYYQHHLYPTYLRCRIEYARIARRQGQERETAALERLRAAAAKRGLVLHALRAEEALGYS